jgi:lipopolysaccharide transport system permease protein
VRDSPTTELIIERGRGSRHYWHDLWNYRELLGFLAWRDIKIRYKQTVLGAAWALIQPAVTLVVFSFVFGRLAKMPSGNVPYPLLVMAGLLPWQLFANAFSNAGGSLVGNSHLISKVYFPRLVVPLAAISVALIDFALVLLLYGGLAAWFGVLPSWHIVFLPFLMALALLIAFGAGLWITALTVKYRDFRFITPFLLQVGVFVTPVGFRTDNLPNWRGLLALNPLTGVIDGFRWCLLGGDFHVSVDMFGPSVLVGALLLGTGLWYFRRTERTFADII